MGTGQHKLTRLRGPRWAIACLVSLAAAGLARADGCRIERVGQAELTQRNGHYQVPVSINGLPEVPFVVDTGAERTHIHTQVATELFMPLRQGRRTFVTGTDGERGAPSANVVARRMEFAGVQRFDHDMVVDAHMIDGKPASFGVLGADMLSDYDVEFDFPRSLLTLYRVKDCAAADPAFRPWSTPYTAVPLKRSKRTLSLPVVLDGKQLELALDTGAVRSKISLQAAADKLGLDIAQLKATAPHNVSSSGTGRQMSNYARQFRRVEIGASSYANIEIKVSEIRVEPYDGLLGLDFLRSRKIWVSYATQQLLVDETRRK